MTTFASDQMHDAKAVAEVKEHVKYSTFGCVNCLWAGIECKGQEKFKAETYNGVLSCENYTYYD